MAEYRLAKRRRRGQLLMYEDVHKRHMRECNVELSQWEVLAALHSQCRNGEEASLR